nr:zinc ribbon domain-containing protein [uncultured Oscillibacter sp.]
MNEKLQNLLDLIQRTALQAGDLAADAVYGAGQMADDLLSSAKLRVRAATVEGDINGKLMEVGEMVYATHTGNPTESEALLAKLQEIDELKAQLSDIRDALDRRPRGKVCPACGAAVREGDTFCGECGGPL